MSDFKNTTYEILSLLLTLHSSIKIDHLALSLVTGHYWVSLFSGLDYWTGTLDWTTGLTYFWFLHILWLDFC